MATALPETSLPGTSLLIGTPLHPWSMDETVAYISKRLDDGRFTQQVSLNVAKLVRMRRDAALRRAVTGCDVINADGMGIVWGARLLGLKVPERVAGIDLFVRLLAAAERRQQSVFFLGAQSAVLERSVASIVERHPNLKVAGTHHGYFWKEPDGERRVVDLVRDSGAQLLFVAMSSPKKEDFVHRWRGRLRVTFTMGIGGSLDVLAGKTRRAPLWMQRLGLEWFFRLLQEPRRMWKRYFVTNGIFVGLLIRERLRRTVQRTGGRNRAGGRTSV